MSTNPVELGTIMDAAVEEQKKLLLFVQEVLDYMDDYDGMIDMGGFYRIAHRYVRFVAFPQ